MTTYSFDEHELDTQRQELRRGDEIVAVEPQVFAVLTHLLTHRDRVVDKEELLDAVWRTRFVTESALTSRIKAARRAIGDDGSTQRSIRTIHGRGYRFVGDVTVRGEPGPVPTAPDEVEELDVEMRYCRSLDGVRIACATTGRGRPLVKAANWLTHLRHDAGSLVWRHWVHDLSRRYRLVRYDERGCGKSDWDAPDVTFDDWVRDLETVVDAIGLERFPLLGISQGGAVAATYAARHPERVSHLVLYGAFPLGRTRRARSEAERRDAALMLDLLGSSLGARVGLSARDRDGVASMRSTGTCRRCGTPIRARPQGGSARTVDWRRRGQPDLDATPRRGDAAMREAVGGGSAV